MAPRTVEAQLGDPLVQFDQPWSPAYEAGMARRVNAGIDRFLDGLLLRTVEGREKHWRRDLSSEQAYAKSVEPNRARLRRIIGLEDARLPVEVERFSRGGDSPILAETREVTIYQVRWPVLEGLSGEGLLLTPKSATRSHVVAIPDADQLPEDIAGLSAGANPWALRLAASGAQVLIPALIDRSSRHSGGTDLVSPNPWRKKTEPVSVLTNIPHREWIWRQAYPHGRHPIGLEVQKVLAAADWFSGRSDRPLGVAGYGEGGLLALYAAAVDPRIDAVLVSGYFGPRERLSTEPIYRSIWGLLEQFGDAEIASLVVPRRLVIEHSPAPVVSGPPPATEGRRPYALPGSIPAPSPAEAEREYQRLLGFFRRGAVRPRAVSVPSSVPGSAPALAAFLEQLGGGPLLGSSPVEVGREVVAVAARQREQLAEMVDFLDDLLDTQDRVRYDFMRPNWSSVAEFSASLEPYREYLYAETIGRIDEVLLPPNPRMRKVYDEEKWTGHEVVLDVWPGVVAWGLLAIPKNLAPGEKRPTVVVQHGRAGTPSTSVRVDTYNNILPRLAERGFVVFSPYNPYEFNLHKAFPLKTSVFSVILPQYRQIVDWLKSTEHVAPDRMAFYGKSWGGRTALYVSPFIPEFKAIISSAYFNQWPRKVMTTQYGISYLFEESVGVYQFDIGNTFGHAELAMLSMPRPFMVESGYADGVAPHEWVAYEFAKVKRAYDLLGVGSRAVLGFHIGGHEVHAGTILPFLHEHLTWPVPPVK